MVYYIISFVLGVLLGVIGTIAFPVVRRAIRGRGFEKKKVRKLELED